MIPKRGDKLKKIAVIGAGSWGTAIAILLAGKEYHVNLWARTPAVAINMQQQRENVQYLAGVTFPEALVVTSDLASAVSGAAVVVIATPTHGVRDTLRSMLPYIREDTYFVSAAKGFEVNSLLRMTEVIASELPFSNERVAVLSGPNHAEEVSRGIPTTTVIAARKRLVAEFLQDIFMTSTFRVYTNPDIVGVEIGGALKNIIALGAGIADGLQFGDNSKAALMTRGLAEITRLGMAMGARPLTFAGLSGLGDLVVTCTSMHSRNRRAGIEIGRGKTMEEVVAGTGMVVEGIRTTQAAYHLAQKFGVEMPITEQIYKILYERKDPREAVVDLMLRGKTHELEEVVIDKVDW
jgi:glycerol-3-phosphate dehydrogenase (NAD(P)+)